MYRISQSSPPGRCGDAAGAECPAMQLRAVAPTVWEGVPACTGDSVQCPVLPRYRLRRVRSRRGRLVRDPIESCCAVEQGRGLRWSLSSCPAHERETLPPRTLRIDVPLSCCEMDARSFGHHCRVAVRCPVGDAVGGVRGHERGLRQFDPAAQADACEPSPDTTGERVPPGRLCRGCPLGIARLLRVPDVVPGFVRLPCGRS